MNARLAGPHLTAIGSGKGGTGKTLMSISLAHALTYEGERVLLLDADLGLSNTAVHLGLETGGDLAAVLSGSKTIADAVTPVLGGIHVRGGFDLLAAPSGCGLLANTSDNCARALVKKLRGATAYDRVLIDLGAGVDSLVLCFASAADETLLVMTPDPASLTDAYAFAKLLLRETTRNPRILVNMAGSESEAQRTADALSTTCKAFLRTAPGYLGAVPRDQRASDAVRRQSHMLTLYPQGPASRAIEAVARRLHGEIGSALPGSNKLSIR